MPITVRRAIELIGLYFLGVVIVAGRDIIAPLLMAFFLSIMLLPLHRWLRKRKLPDSMAIGLSLLALVLVLAGIIWFFSSQISQLMSDFPTIRKNVQLHLNSLRHWIESSFGIPMQRQAQLLQEQNEKLMDWVAGMAGGAASSVSGILVFVGLLPIYIFLLLFYRSLLLRFVFMWFPQPAHARVAEAVRESEVIVKSYLVGLLIQVTYVTVLLGAILMVLGIKHAILIGAIFAILNLIPYVGALIGNIIGVLITLSSSSELWPILAVLASIAVVQFFDNNILMPRIVGSKVRINALATIIAVVVAGALAGISGMFLSLPLIAVLKVIFDRSEGFRQWGVLLGDERSQQSQGQEPSLSLRNREQQQQIEAQQNMEQPQEEKVKSDVSFEVPPEAKHEAPGAQSEDGDSKSD